MLEARCKRVPFGAGSSILARTHHFLSPCCNGRHRRLKPAGPARVQVRLLSGTPFVLLLRPTVGHDALNVGMGVRIPQRQPFQGELTRQARSWEVQQGFRSDTSECGSSPQFSAFWKLNPLWSGRPLETGWDLRVWGSSPPVSATWNVKQLGCCRRLEPGRCRKRHGLRVVRVPPFCFLG